MESLKEYIQDCIDLSEYEIEDTFLNVLKVMKKEADYLIRTKGLNKGLEVYIKRLPNYLNIEYSYRKIRFLLYALGEDWAKDCCDVTLDKWYFENIVNIIISEAKQEKRIYKLIK